MTWTPGALDQRLDHQGRTIPRGRLAATVADGLESGSVVLTAGAGFGKTTVVEQALEGRTSAWLSCADGDRASGTLLMRIVKALAGAVPGTTDAFAEGLAAGLEPVDVSAATDELIMELSQLLMEPVVLVIDDTEHLEGAAGSLTLIGKLIRAQVPSLHLAIASRVALGLRVAKVRAAGHLLELSAADLAFDTEECEALLRARAGPQAANALDRVMAATEGWPLGVALAAGLIQRGTEDGSLAGLASTPDVQAYLSEELFESLEPELREATLDSSIARIVSPGVVAALGAPDDLLERLERGGVLLRRIGDDGSFAYHPLLREFLAERLRAERSAEDQRRLHGAVAPAIAKDGDPIGAIEHWLEAGSWAEATAMIESQGVALIRTSPDLLQRWLAMLPPDVAAQPTMRALDGHIEWGAGNHPAAAEAMREAIAGFRDRPNAAFEWLARFVLADALFNIGEFEAAVDLVDGWDGEEADAAGFLAPATVIYVAICLASIGRFEESEALAAKALRHPEAAILAPVEVIRFSFHEWPKGNLDPPYRQALRTLEELERFDPLNRRLYLLATLGIMLTDRGQPAEALEAWMRVREGAAAGGTPFLADASQAIAAILHAIQGRLREAEVELAQHRGLERGWRRYVGHEGAGAVAALRGDAATAIEQADLCMESVERAPILFHFWAAADSVMMLALVGNLERAGEVLELTMARVDEVLPGELGRYPRCRLMAMRAWLHELAGNETAADSDIQEFWRESDGCRRFAVRVEWPKIHPIVWRGLERGLLDPEEAVAAVSEAFPGGVPLVPFLDHPVGAVRRAALEPAIASGSPEALEAMSRLEKDSDEEMAEAAADAGGRLAASLPPRRFGVLGGFRVARGAWSTTEETWGRPADARLVRFLLVNLDQPVLEDVIFEALWPELSADSAKRSLQVSVSRVRKLLDAPGAGRSLIHSAHRSYRLELGERDTIDAEEFRFAADASLMEHGEARRSLLEHARSLWAGEPLPEERYSDWAAAYRERLMDRHIAVLDALVDLYAEAGDHADAADAARELVDLDPLNEGGHRALMAAYARSGRRGHALRQYLACRRALIDTLGVEPAEETARLQARILAGEAV